MTKCKNLKDCQIQGNTDVHIAEGERLNGIVVNELFQERKNIG